MNLLLTLAAIAIAIVLFPVFIFIIIMAVQFAVNVLAWILGFDFRS